MFYVFDRDGKFWDYYLLESEARTVCRRHPGYLYCAEFDLTDRQRKLVVVELAKDAMLDVILK